MVYLAVAGAVVAVTAFALTAKTKGEGISLTLFDAVIGGLGGLSVALGGLVCLWVDWVVVAVTLSVLAVMAMVKGVY